MSAGPSGVPTVAAEPEYDQSGWPLDYDGVFATLCHAAAVARIHGKTELADKLDALIEAYE